MVKIPDKGDPTLDAIRNKSVELHSSQPHRSYIGASIIGEECARKIYLGYRHPELASPFDCDSIYRFDDGHRTEDLIISRLKQSGFLEVWDKDENGEQYGFSEFGGKFSGHADGIIRGLLQSPKTVHVLEIKCTEKLAAFQRAKLKCGDKGALKEWNFKYFVQAQIYMHYFNLDRHYTIVASAGGRSMDSCRTEYEKEVALQYIDRAKALIDAVSEPPRISEKPDFFLCRMCQFHGHCHG